MLNNFRIIRIKNRTIMKLKLISAVMLYFVMTLALSAQEALTAAGGKATGTGGSVCYSIGQMVYYTYTGTNGNSISQGVEQAFEISVVSSISQIDEINLELLAYPNPTSDFLSLKVGDISDIQYEAYLYTINGELLQKIKINESETQIAMQDYVPAVYFLKVTTSNKEIKVFKIIKK